MQQVELNLDEMILDVTSKSQTLFKMMRDSLKSLKERNMKLEDENSRLKAAALVAERSKDQKDLDELDKKA